MATSLSTSNLSGGKTGDLKNNVVKLLTEVQRMKLEVKVDLSSWCVGTPSSFLPVMHSALVQYSLPLAEWLLMQGYSLYGKSDLKFIEGVYRVLRQVFSYRPKLTREQFLAKGYTERKVMLTCDLLLLCQAKHIQLTSSSADNKRGISVSVDGSHKKRGYGPENNPPEVLTLHERAGIGSAWKEPIPVQTYAYDEPEDVQGPEQQLSCDDQVYTIPTPDHVFSAHKHSSPIQSPETVIHVPVSPSPTSSPSLSPPPARPHPTTFPSHFPPPLSSSSTTSSSLTARPSCGQEPKQDSDYVDMCVARRHERGEEEVRSWKPLPVAPGETQEEIANDPLLKDLGTRVAHLTKLMEQMSARFVLVETQLMLARTQGREEEGRGEGREKDPLHMLSTSKGDNNWPHLPAPDESGILGRLDARELTLGSVARPDTPSYDRTTLRLDTNPHSSPFLDNNRPRGATFMTGHPLPPSTRSHPPPTASPSTEETQQLINKLRSRAQKTRLFLQQATTSSGTGRYM